MHIHPTITADRIIAAVAADDMQGFCAHCGAECNGVLPDARGCECETCGSFRVMGAEELLNHIGLEVVT